MLIFHHKYLWTLEHYIRSHNPIYFTSHQYYFSTCKFETLSCNSLIWTVHRDVIHYSILIIWLSTRLPMNVPEVSYPRKTTLQLNILKLSFHIISFANMYLLLVIKLVLVTKAAFLYSSWIQPTQITSVAYVITYCIVTPVQQQL